MARRRRRRRRGGGDPLERAAARLGVKRLRAEQRRAIEAVLAGRDALVVLPTGYGKSLIYQVPGLVGERPVVVISPLIALMADQEQKLQARGVPVVRLDSTLRAAARREALARIAAGGKLIVLTTPETLVSEAAAEVLRAGQPSLLCVDEAHCISEWGHDFRPAYLQIAAAREALGIPVTLALTATATPRVREDVKQRLGLRDPLEVVAPPHRENLRLAARVAPGDHKYDALARLIRRLQRPGIIYCATTRAVDGVHGALQRTRVPVERYHGGMSAGERDTAQRRFMRRGRKALMVATNAFGMGIDKADIRTIIHFQTPGSLEQYVQEAGRAGRDGKTADCVLLFDPQDLDIQEHLQRSGRPRPAELRRVAAALAAWGDEGRPATAREVALSAGARITATQSLFVELERLGLLARAEGRRYRATAPAARLQETVDGLAARYETQRLQDAERLEAMAAYAQAEECRSAFIRRWFGEEDPPRCGRCDWCRFEQAERAEQAQGQPRGARGRRRRRRQKKKGQREAPSGR